MEWKFIPGYENYYQASTSGEVRSVDRVIDGLTKNGKPRKVLYKGRVLKPYKKNNGRLQVVLSVCGRTKSLDVHYLIAKTFLVKECENYEINHKDGNLDNNSVSNLEWITRKENIKHAFSNSLYSTMKKVALLNDNGEIEKVYLSESDACRQNGIAQGKISRAIKRNGRSCGMKWAWINEGVTTSEKWTSPTE